MNKKEHIKDLNDSHIFIVEDNDMHSLMMDYVLSNETTAHITKFKSGEECIENLHLNPDIIILDYGLPGINGIDTYNEIKKLNPDLPVIVVTESTDNKVAQKFFKAGVSDFIRKEENAFELVSKVTDKILSITVRREAKIASRNANIFMIVIGAMIVIGTLLSYVLLKH
ncbi:MAG TPA: response regulator [Bacteroidia bacterium]|nr:response regulator [Bacteroidia bacterium]